MEEPGCHQVPVLCSFHLPLFICSVLSLTKWYIFNAGYKKSLPQGTRCFIFVPVHDLILPHSPEPGSRHFLCSQMSVPTRPPRLHLGLWNDCWEMTAEKWLSYRQSWCSPQSSKDEREILPGHQDRAMQRRPLLTHLSPYRCIKKQISSFFTPNHFLPPGFKW